MLDLLIEALHAAADLDALLVALHDRIALSAHVHDSPERRCALAFDTVEASVNSYEKSNPQIEKLRAHLHSPVLDVARRVRASRLLMIAADDAVDPDFAREVFQVNEGLSPSDEPSRLQRLHARLIYQTIFGSRSIAIQCADAIAERAHYGECSWSIMNSELNASMAKHMVDDAPTSYSHLAQRFEDCMSGGMKRLALRFSARICLFLVNEGCIDEANRWGRLSEGLAEGQPINRLSGDYLTSQIDLALVAGRLTQARSLVELMLTRAPLEGSSRLSVESQLYSMRLEQFSGNDVDDKSLSALLAWHERAKTYGRHDDKVEVLWVALMARQQAEKASALLTEYLLSARRERRPPNWQLRLRTESDPAWAAFSAHAAFSSPTRTSGGTETLSEMI